MISLATTTHQHLLFTSPPSPTFQHSNLGISSSRTPSALGYPDILSSLTSDIQASPPSASVTSLPRYPDLFFSLLLLTALPLDIRALSFRAIQTSIVSNVLVFHLVGHPSYSILNIMSSPISRRERQGRTDPRRPPLPARCVGLDPAINLCRIPKTEDARTA